MVNAPMVAGLVSGASRFVPVPLVDDLLREQSERFAEGQLRRLAEDFDVRFDRAL